MNNRFIENGADLEFRPMFFDPEESEVLFQTLLADVQWRQEQIRMWGNIRDIPRLTAWYGDPEAVYTYSKIGMKPNPWTEVLATLKEVIEQSTGHHFNSVLLNLYRDGKDHVSWHSDDEPELGDQPTIASLSLGGERRFRLQHKETKQQLEYLLSPGSLLVMRGDTQKYWQHCIAKTSLSVPPRINLTFRLVRGAG